MQNKGYYTVQGHSRSPISVPILRISNDSITEQALQWTTQGCIEKEQPGNAWNRDTGKNASGTVGGRRRW